MSYLLKLLFFLPLLVNVTASDSAIYFPTGEEFYRSTYRPNETNSSNIQISENVDVTKRTNMYEKYVEDLISRGMYKLTIEINKLLISQSVNYDNVLFSPLSIASVLALVMLGSNGITFKQITQLWGLHTGIPDIAQKSQIVHEQFARMLQKLNRTSGFEFGDEVSVASALFVQDGFPIRPVYRSIVEDLYHSSIVSVNFESNPQAAKDQINSWVAARTNQKIKNILGENPSTLTKIIIASALYFRAEWEQHFFTGLTKRRPFYIDGRKSKTSIEADMMANGGEFPYYKDANLGCEIMGFPYKGNKSTMYVVVPFDSSRDNLIQFQSRITEVDLNILVNRTQLTDSVVMFPRMKIDSTLDLTKTLQLLGVTSLFDPKQSNLALLSPGYVPQGSTFDGTVRNLIKSTTNQVLNQTFDARLKPSLSIDNIRQLINEHSLDNNFQNPGLYADQVIHKVFMDITEKGTEAAATTLVSLSRTGNKVTFRVDVPFFFFIRHDETNTILFWGSILSPHPNYNIQQ